MRKSFWILTIVSVCLAGQASLSAGSGQEVPTLEDILRGHRLALGSLPETTLYVRGTFDAENWDGGNQVFEMYYKAPGRWLELWKSNGRVVRQAGFDGRSGWSERFLVGGIRAWDEREAAERVRDFHLRLGRIEPALYESLALAGESTVAGVPVHIIDAADGFGGSDRLYVGVGDHRLHRYEATRRFWVIDDIYEETPFTFDLGDYRDVGGSLVPFEVRRDGPFHYSLEVGEVRPGVDVPDEDFSQPAESGGVVPACTVPPSVEGGR